MRMQHTMKCIYPNRSTLNEEKNVGMRYYESMFGNIRMFLRFLTMALVLLKTREKLLKVINKNFFFVLVRTV